MPVGLLPSNFFNANISIDRCLKGGNVGVFGWILRKRWEIAFLAPSLVFIRQRKRKIRVMVLSVFYVGGERSISIIEFGKRPDPEIKGKHREQDNKCQKAFSSPALLFRS